MENLTEIYVHLVRFGEGLRLAKDKMNEKNVYYMNPAFDK